MADGMTLVELLIATAIVSMVVTSMGAMLYAALDAQRFTDAHSRLSRMAQIAILRMGDHCRVADRLFIPDEAEPLRDVLAVSSMIDEDGDGKTNEDPGRTIDGSVPGIEGVDDDGDGTIDEGVAGDDDEDGQVDEDPINGMDDDGDGRVDEDHGADSNGDGKPGDAKQDDDGDGTADEGETADDDEDGATDEDGYAPIVYYLSGGNLMERHPVHGTNTVATDVTEFTVERTKTASQVVLVSIHLKLDDGNGCVVEANKRVFPRNLR